MASFQKSDKPEVTEDTIIDMGFMAEAKDRDVELGALLKHNGIYQVRIKAGRPMRDGILLTLKTIDKDENDSTLFKNVRLIGDATAKGKDAASGLQSVLFALGYSEAEVRAFSDKRMKVKEIIELVTLESKNTTHVEVAAKAIKGNVQSDVGFFQTANDLAAKKKAGRAYRSAYDLESLQKEASKQAALGNAAQKARAESGGGAPGLPGVGRNVNSPPVSAAADADV